MKCKDCKHWQGTKYSEWADCYRIVRDLEPDLECCYLTNAHGTVTEYFTVPFDPHDIKYWNFNPIWKKLYDNLILAKLGVRMVEEVVDDVIYDQSMGERIGKLRLRYFQTHKEYECNGRRTEV